MKVRNIFENAFKLNEVFNTKVDISWRTLENKDIGTFELLNNTYRILIEAGTFKEFNFLNIAFEIFDEKTNNFSRTLTLDNQAASKVLGAVRNGVVARIPIYDFDAVIFFANDNQDKRMKIYNAMASEFIKKFGYIKDNYKLSDGRIITMIMKKDFAKQSNEFEKTLLNK